ncbi:hypothetical protein [Paraburkholderia sp. GAS82]|uniref:hypothetical protein n=1 Tax=Paraburkholderia sp. GAS82 TaxID=3035137 RepID=UPI003D224B67
MGKLQLEHLEISHHVWNAEPEETRYAVLLLGHIFNEVMTLQKLAIVSIPHPSDPETPEKIGRVSRALFLSRMLSGKVHEAKERINKPEINTFLRERCYPHMPDGKGERLKRTFNKMIGDCKWLAAARNEHAMHYPSLIDLRPAMEQMKASSTSYVFYRNRVAGNYLYQTSAEVAIHAYHMESEDEWAEAVRKMTDTVNALSAALVEFIVENLNAYLGNLYRMHKDTQAKIEEAAPFDVPPIRGFDLPYFYTTDDPST